MSPAPQATDHKASTMGRKILIVDDDQKTRTLLKTYLEKQQYEVALSHNGESFLVEFTRQGAQFSLVILDVMLPDTDGFALCRAVRARSNVPIIMLTASSDETDRIVGLELGADDYIAKPYSPRELLARIKAILRRSAPEAAATRYYHFDGFTLDPARLAKAGLEAEAVAAEAATLIAACPGVARVLTAAELARGPGEDDPVALAISRSFRPERSPDLFVHWEEGLLPVLGRGTTHATAWQYDRRVPLVVLGPGVVPGRRAEPAATVDLAPTLAALLGVPVPADVAGRPLPVGEPPTGG